MSKSKRQSVEFYIFRSYAKLEAESRKSLELTAVATLQSSIFFK